MDDLFDKLSNTLLILYDLKLKTPKYIPWSLHNISNYDTHFVITELGYDTNKISVRPSTEENNIAFDEYIN